MKTETRDKVQDIALVALATYCMTAAALWAKNPFSLAAFIGTAIMGLAVVGVMAQMKKNPKAWEPRMGLARRVVWTSTVVVVALFVLGHVF
ncbi:UNVERIFIED_ORG: hypothetical protein ABIB52_000726 [Arthrobacter sp. UYCu721]